MSPEASRHRRRALLPYLGLNSNSFRLSDRGPGGAGLMHHVRTNATTYYAFGATLEALGRFNIEHPRKLLKYF